MKPRLEASQPSKNRKGLAGKKGRSIQSKASTSKVSGKGNKSSSTAGPLMQHEDLPLTELSTMTVEEFKMWSIEALHIFLRLRKKSITGNLDTLAARAFIAWEEKIPVDPNEEHTLRINLQDYKSKLCIGGDTLPDPFTLEKGWLSEINKLLWPPVYFHDITGYFQSKTSANLYHRLCNEYKEGKGYRYFTDGHVGEVFYHPNTANIGAGFFAAHVKPSMKNIPHYQVWVAVEKKSDTSTGGRIYSAYCTCTSGLHGSCNHVAGLVFRVEYAVRCGITNPSCTSLPCVWSVPSQLNKKKETPRPLTDYIWKKEQYSNADHGDHQKSVRQLANEFSSMSKSQESYVSKSERVRNDLAELLKGDLPNACFIQSFYATPFPEEPKVECPPTPMEIAKTIDISESGDDLIDSIKELKVKLALNADDRALLSKATVSQGDSAEWLAHRNGRITASNIKGVCTRTLTVLNRNVSEERKDTTCLTKKLMGYTKVPDDLISIKHGRAMEPHAKRMYRKVMRKHKAFRTSDTGLHLHKVYPYIGASPDLLVSCQCCGKGLCEIKCPESIKFADPKTAAYPHFIDDNGERKLSKTSPFYYQIQAQLGVLELKYCDFFVYTAHGYHLERIKPDACHWERTLMLCDHYWSRYVAAELLTGNIQAAMEESTRKNILDHTYIRQLTEADGNIQPVAVTEEVKPPLTRPVLPQVSFCSLCKCDMKFDTSDNCKGNIECQNCRRWFHLLCMDITEEDGHEMKVEWVCDICLIE